MKKLDQIVISNKQIFTLMAISAVLSALSYFGAGHEFLPFFLGAFLASTALTILNNMHTLRQYEKGAEDCAKGLPHREGMSEEYDMGYGFQYMKEQNENVRSEQCQIQE